MNNDNIKTKLGNTGRNKEHMNSQYMDTYQKLFSFFKFLHGKLSTLYYEIFNIYIIVKGIKTTV